MVKNSYQLIKEYLELIEKRHDIKIIYACEGGSRIYGTCSKDSDYDIRFIYFHPLEWYLTLQPGTDIITESYTLPNQTCLHCGDNIEWYDFDFHGWDLKKALTLFTKRNPSIFEWLNSTCIYKEIPEYTRELRSLKPLLFDKRSCLFHYKGWAHTTFYGSIYKKEIVRLKKYLYVIRPLAAAHWLVENLYQPPNCLFELLDFYKQDIPVDVFKEIEKLINRKLNGIELENGPNIHILSEFIISELDRLETISLKENKNKNIKNEIIIPRVNKYFVDVITGGIHEDEYDKSSQV